MAEFVQVMKDWRRMCEKNRIDCMRFCQICANPICGELAEATDEDIRNAEDKVMAWAAEHPEPVYPSWAEWLIEQGIYVGTFVKDKPRPGDRIVDLRITDKVYQPIDADLAQKLGIEPKEG